MNWIGNNQDKINHMIINTFAELLFPLKFDFNILIGMLQYVPRVIFPGSSLGREREGNQSLGHQNVPFVNQKRCWLTFGSTCTGAKFQPAYTNHVIKLCLLKS